MILSRCVLHHFVLHVDEVGQADSLDQLHHEVLLAAGGAAVLEGPDDMRVDQLAGDLPLGGLHPVGKAGLVAERLLHGRGF